MFIEIIEYTQDGEKVGKCLINTDDVYYIDNYNDDYKVWQLHLRSDNTNDDIYFYIKDNSYYEFKKILTERSTMASLDIE